MEFNEHHKVLIDSMTATEARAYLLVEEQKQEWRKAEITLINSIMNDAHNRSGHDTEGAMSEEAYRLTCEESIRECQVDIADRDALIKRVKERFNL